MPVAVERTQDDRPGRVQAVPLPSKEHGVVHDIVRTIVAPDAHLMTAGGPSLVRLTEPRAGGAPSP